MPGPAIDVSVIIPTWNAARTIDAAIDSALRQEDVEVEIIVADDGSTDGTAAAVRARQAADRRVRLLESPHNAGPSAARNRAIDAAAGTWVALLDGDDQFRPGRLATLLALARRQDADLVADNLNLVDAATGLVVRTAFPVSPLRRGTVVGIAEFVANNHLQAEAMSYGYMKPLIRRSLIVGAGIRYDTALRIGEDYHFYLDLMMAGGRMVYTSEAFYDYALTPGSLSRGLSVDHLQALLEGSTRSIARAGEIGQAGLRETLMHRHRTIETNIAHATFIRAIKDGRIGVALGILRRDPAVRPVVVRFGLESVRKRLARLGKALSPGRPRRPIPSS
jgi:succinoglycan biosynthesis protein ExoO